MIPDDLVQGGQPFDLCEGFENFCDDRECPMRIHVIAVQPTHDFSGAPRKTFVDRVILLIPIVDPPLQLSFVLPQDLVAGVGRSVIDHEIFERRVLLLKNGANGLFEILRLIKRRGDDGDLQT